MKKPTKMMLLCSAIAAGVLATAGCGRNDGPKQALSGTGAPEDTVAKNYTDSDAMGLNPILPLYEYVPDGEPHVYEDRLYLFGSHDQFKGSTFCMNDYVTYSASTDDLTHWDFGGTIYRKEQDPRYKENSNNYLYAPDVVQGKDGRYYLFYCLNLHPEIGVAVCDTPDGGYEYYGLVRHSDGTPLGRKADDYSQFDPALFIDDNGSIYLYSGNSVRRKGAKTTSTSQVMQLEDDMLTLKTEPKALVPTVENSGDTGFEGHEFFEASSMRKIEDTYYFIYSSVNLHELCYATSSFPDKDFTYGGVLISNADIMTGEDGNSTRAMNQSGNNHGSLVCVNDQWYIFYHRHTNNNSYSREACAERITIEKDGSIPQVEMTTTGLSSVYGKTADWISAGRACIVCGNYNNPSVTGHKVEDNAPYITQLGKDREEDPEQYINNISDYSLIGFKYFNCDGLASITISARGNFNGDVELLNDPGGDALGSVSITETSNDWTEYTINVSGMSGNEAVYFSFKGTGMLQMKEFKMNFNN